MLMKASDMSKKRKLCTVKRNEGTLMTSSWDPLPPEWGRSFEWWDWKPTEKPSVPEPPTVFDRD